MLLALGKFIFSIPTLSYQDLQRKLEYKHVSSSRVGLRDAHQFTGLGNETLSLNGKVSHEFGSFRSLAELETMAAAGDAYLLVEGTGRIYGQFVITSISQKQSIFFKDGLAKSINFTLDLKRVDSGAQIVPGNDNIDPPPIEWLEMDLIV